MELIGDGFLARHLRSIQHRHPDVVLLAAGISRPSNPESAYERETALVEETVRRCRRHDRTLVFLSTSLGMYGGPGCQGREDEPVDPPTRYGRHKRSLELLIQESGADHLTLRLAHVAGPDNPAHRLLPELVRQIREGRVTIFRGAVRDLLDVADFVTIVNGLLERHVTGEVLNVASGCAAPVEEIVAHLQRRLGIDAQPCFVEAGGGHQVSVDKLRRLLPSFEHMNFSPGYYRVVIDRYCAQTGITQ